MPATTKQDPRPRSARLVSGWDLACLGLVVVWRAVLLLSTRSDIAFRVPYLDGAFYHAWARSLSEGHGDFQGPYFLGPLYPYALSLLYRIFGPEPLAARVVQAGLGVLDAALLLSLGRRLFGTAAARAAVVLLALYGPLAFYENILVMESLLVTLTLAALWVLFVPQARPLGRAAVAGILLGLASLGRPTVLVLAPAVWLALRQPGVSWRRNGTAWRGLAACGLAWALVVLPVLVRNSRAGGGLVISTNGGINFYAGNNAAANGRFHAPPGVRFFTSPVFATATQAELPPAVAARALTVKAAAGTDAAADSRHWRALAWDWIRAHPVDAVGLLLRKAWLVLQAREIPQIESYAFHAARLPALRAFVVDFGWLWPLAGLGIWSARRRRVAGLGAVLAFTAALLFPCLAFFVTARYRLACVPEAALLAGCGVATLADWARRRQWRPVALACVALLPLAIATRLGAQPPAGAAGWEQAQMAERLYALGDLAAAIEYQERAARLLPERSEVQLNLALYWSERAQPGDLDRAERVVRELVRRRPSEPLFHFNLGAILEQEGRTEEARAAWNAALAADPNFEPARSRLLELRQAPDGKP